MDFKYQKKCKKINSRYLIIRNYNKIEVLNLKRKFLDKENNNINIKELKRLKIINKKENKKRIKKK